MLAKLAIIEIRGKENDCGGQRDVLLQSVAQVVARPTRQQRKQAIGSQCATSESRCHRIEALKPLFAQELTKQM